MASMISVTSEIDAPSWNTSLMLLTKMRLGSRIFSTLWNAVSLFGLTTPVQTALPLTIFTVPA
jgi:hypothetical protein